MSHRQVHHRAPRRARILVAEALRRTGLLRLWMWLNRKRITILTLHGTMQMDETCSWRPLREQYPPSRLEDALAILARHYRFVSLEDAAEMVAGRKPVRPYSIAVTFDDGYRNNLTHALPVLRKHNVPATIFLTTGHVEEQRPFWCDRLDYALQQVSMQGREVVVGGRRLQPRGSSREDLAEFYAEIRATAKNAALDDEQMRSELECLAAKLERESGVALRDTLQQDAWAAVLRWEEAREAASDPMLEFGSHTVDHVLLRRTSEEDAVRQLRESKRAVEENLGKDCRYLAYPNGSYDASIAKLVRECGYEAAVTSDSGTVKAGHDLFSLPRISLGVHETPADLLATVSGLWSVVALLRGRLAKLRRRVPTPMHSGGKSTWPVSA